MDAKRFLAEFGHIAGAPGGVQRLRELTLQLAVTGKLVKSHKELSIFPSLQKWAGKKERLIKNKEIPKQPRYFDISIDKQPFTLASGWKFVRLGEITIKIGSGSTPRGGAKAYIKKGVPFLRSQNIWNSGVVLDDVAFIPDEIHQKMKNTHVMKHDILLNITGASLGRCALVSAGLETANVSQHVSIIRPIDPAIRQYLHLCILSPYVQQMIWGSQVGMAREGLSKKVLEQFQIPLPPLEEQSIIVAKVDELMALCDKLEAQQQEKRKLQNHLRQATLQAVANAESPKALQEGWKRLEGNFSHLFAETEDVEELRNAILKLSSSGRLTVPLDTDTSAEETLKNISGSGDLLSLREKRELQSLPEISKEDNSKLKLSLGHVARVISGQHLKPESYNTNGIGIPYITGPAEFEEGVPKPNKWTEERRAVAKKGDILLTVKGSGVGKIAICDTDELAISRQLMAISPIEGVNKAFIATTIDAANDYFQQQKVGIAIPGIGRKEVLTLDMVLSSIEEQERIVRRTNNLMRFCNTLEEKLQSANKTAEHLATAAISTLTGITTPQQEAPMKAPKTELKAPVRLGKTEPTVKDQAPLTTLLNRHNGELSANDLWQRFGGEIDTFYAQLKTEVEQGWITEPTGAQMLEKEAD